MEERNRDLEKEREQKEDSKERGQGRKREKRKRRKKKGVVMRCRVALGKGMSGRGGDLRRCIRQLAEEWDGK